MTCGIYKIENTENNKVYIGSSKNIEKRWKCHQKQLETKTHHNAKMQHAWNKSKGSLPLIYSIIEECKEDDLFVREQHWMDFYDSFNIGYNCTRLAQGSPNPVKTSVWIKSEPLFAEIFQNLYEFDTRRKDSIANAVVVSFYGLKAGEASSNTAFVRRLWKASFLILDILDALESADLATEYRLHYIHYSGKKAEFSLTPEYNSAAKAKYSQHNKSKRNNILDEIWGEIEDCFTGRVGKGIKQRYDLYLQGVDVDGE